MRDSKDRQRQKKSVRTRDIMKNDWKTDKKDRQRQKKSA